MTSREDTANSHNQRKVGEPTDRTSIFPNLRSRSVCEAESHSG